MSKDSPILVGEFVCWEVADSDGFPVFLLTVSLSEAGDKSHARRQRVGFDRAGIEQLLASGIDLLADCGDETAILLREVLYSRGDGSGNGKAAH
jgi:hypothetical protein